MRMWIAGLAFSLLTASVAFAAPADDGKNAGLVGEKVFYRYTNAAGAKVMHHSLPADAVQNGYEIVSLSGVVLKVVPRALSGAEAERAAEKKAEQQELDEWDAALLRRYSTVEDIEAAKQRKLADLEANMSILISNLNTVQGQVRSEYSRGASFERRGQPVPQAIYDTLAGLKQELEDTREKYIQREWEYEDIAEKFELDKERFSLIHTKK
ncbi:hypothetical protein R50072_39000 [Simiduia litorea]|uniref:hypothetical protein n=1 Tax=Simiduia litorea TaxID=1435348 RepID=UPI0036F35D96